MSIERPALVAKKACKQCSGQKRRCDKQIPDCGLCRRLRKTCNYEVPKALSPSPSPKPQVFLGAGVSTANQLRDAIIQKLGPITPEDALSTYCRAIEPWFPISLVPRLRNQLPPVWTEAPLDIASFCLSVILLASIPPSTPEDGDDAREYKSLYLFAKSSITLTEGLGVNSYLIIQSRILVTLFEVAHGLYPAAYISIGATVRAMDALRIHPGEDASTPHSLVAKAEQDDMALTWCGILTLDRLIAIDSGPYPSLTRSRSEAIHSLLKPTLCPAFFDYLNRTEPICRLARIFEAASLLDKVHTTLNSPTTEHTFNIEDSRLTVHTLCNLQTILNEDTRDGIHLYSGGMSLCNIALLLAFENGSKLHLGAGPSNDCDFSPTTSLNSILSTISSTVEPFTLGMQPINFNLLPPFVNLLVYKAAAVITERLLIDSDSNDDLRKLRILRDFLTIVGKRWSGSERYLKLLNEDTTPRVLKVIEKG